MLATDEPVLTAVKAKVEALTFSGFALNAVYRFPDDFTTTPDLTVPFAVIGVLEDVGRVASRDSDSTGFVNYSVYIRFCMKTKEANTTESDFAKIEVDGREIFSILGSEIFTDDTFFGSTASRRGGIEHTAVPIIVDADPFTGYEVVVPIGQAIDL